MYELKKIGNKTYYINCPSKVGIYKVNENDAYIIDSGNDKEAGRKILKIFKENNWNLLGIINTHSNADHIGGNKFIQDRTNCTIISSDIENVFISHPILEPSFLYGGYPCKELRNKFLLAQPSHPSSADLPKGLEYISLGGHYFDMIGIKTDDNIYFLADSLFGENIINKYHFFFVYDVKEFLNTLDNLEKLEGNLYVLSHAEVTKDIKPLIEVNRNKIYEIINKIIEICKEPISFEDILQQLFNEYHLNMDFNQHILVGSTIKSYLSYLSDNGQIEFLFEDNKMLWKSK